MDDRTDTPVTLEPAGAGQFAEQLKAVEQAFVDHLVSDRGVARDEAKRQTRDILRKELDGNRAGGPAKFFSIEQADRQIGCFWLSPRERDDAKIWHILYVEIYPPYRRQGLAAQALQRLREKAARSGVSALTLNVSPKNAAALSLYNRAGFTALDGGLILRLDGRTG